MLALNDCDVRALDAAVRQLQSTLALHKRILRAVGIAPLLQRICEVEASHLKVLEWLHVRHGLPLAKTPRRWRGKRYADASEACAALIAAEKENLAAYRDLLQTARDAEVLAELRNLTRACREGHLPALHSWARQLGHHPVVVRPRCRPAASRVPARRL